MDLFSYPCPFCDGNNIHPHSNYLTQHQGTRTIHYCQDCDYYFNETYNTAIAGLRTPLSRIIQILKVRTEAMGLNATARSFGVSKKSIIDR